MSLMTHFRNSIIAMILFTLILGGVYPLVITGLGKVLFKQQIMGSLVTNAQGDVIGSMLIGQNFQDPKYFWGRPSATSPAYNPLASSGSNLSPTNPQLITAMKARITAIETANPAQAGQDVPVDLATASASGLDPEISPAAAYYQAARIAKARNLAVDQVNALIAQNIRGEDWGLFGEPRVNVLKLNLALDHLGG